MAGEINSYMDLMKYAPVGSTETGNTAPSISGSPDSAPAPTSVPQGKPIASAPAAPQSQDSNEMYGGLAKYGDSSPAPASQGGQPDNGIVNVGSSEGAQDASLGPLSTMDRVALSLGNPKGQAAYLQSKFPGHVAQDTDGKLLINDGGKWFKAESNGDAWELSKKLAGAVTKGNPLFMAPRYVANKVAGWLGKGDAIDAPALSDLNPVNSAKRFGEAANEAGALTGSAMTTAGMIGGGAGGGALGNAPGAIAGSAAGAGAADYLRTSLGRIVGTYQATPDEQLQDAGWEALLGAGGEVVGLGVKPGLKMLSNSLKNFSEYSTPWVKENFAAILEKMGMGDAWSLRRGMDDQAPVVGEVSGVIKKTGIEAPPEVKVGEAVNRQIHNVTTMAEQSKAALQNNYRAAQGEIISQAPASFKADPKQIMSDVQKEMADSGFGLIDEKTGNFRTRTPAELAQAMNVPSEQLPKILGKDTQAAVDKLADMTAQYKNLPNMSGPKGARMLLDFKKAFSESCGEFEGHDVPASIKQIAYRLKDSVNEKIGQRFADASTATNPIGDAYVKMNADYAAKADAVNLFNDAAKNGTVEQLVKKLAAGGRSGKFRTLSGEAKIMADLLGDKGEAMMQRVFDLEAAKAFFPIANKGSAGNAANQVMRGAGKLMGMGNPSQALKKLPYANALVDFLKQNSNHASKLLGNDQLMQSLLSTTIQGYMGQDQLHKQLMGQAMQHIQGSQLPQVQQEGGQ